MKNSTIVAIILVLTGCAPVKFYSNPGLTEKSGFGRRKSEDGRPKSEGTVEGEIIIYELRFSLVFHFQYIKLHVVSTSPHYRIIVLPH